MRELKFRAWEYSQSDKKWRSRIMSLEDIFYDDPIDGFDAYEWEQYTGIQDRGVEIYEGDIIRWVNSVGREITAPVVWNTRAWCWTAGDYMLGGLLEFDLEVVGNIHENPELVKEEK